MSSSVLSRIIPTYQLSDLKYDFIDKGVRTNTERVEPVTFQVRQYIIYCAKVSIDTYHLFMIKIMQIIWDKISLKSQHKSSRLYAPSRRIPTTGGIKQIKTDLHLIDYYCLVRPLWNKGGEWSLNTASCGAPDHKH